ncbi:GIY-YIG nuclease family protein [Microbulbifer sp.]|uniref:GIY-YIG nuclease family protein n=1 Tax=Microbulbifer sp. TaxID=1908541 RepID=UPI0025870950|nr:GIY-YIG nuclease family protein [Microbulbifer sp.]
MKTKTQLAAEARAAGQKLFTATCRHHGPGSPHYVSTTVCQQCAAEQTKRYNSTPKGKAATARNSAKRSSRAGERYVYLLKCKAAGIAYIGATTMALSKRRSEHFCDLRHGTHSNPELLAAYQAHGPKSFTLEVLAQFPGQPVEKLRQYEQCYMDAGEILGLRLVNVRRAKAA